jgi:hypothetical protein
VPSGVSRTRCLPRRQWPIGQLAIFFEQRGKGSWQTQREGQFTLSFWPPTAFTHYLSFDRSYPYLRYQYDFAIPSQPDHEGHTPRIETQLPSPTKNVTCSLKVYTRLSTTEQLALMPKTVILWLRDMDVTIGSAQEQGLIPDLSMHPEVRNKTHSHLIDLSRYILRRTSMTPFMAGMVRLSCFSFTRYEYLPTFIRS